MTWTTLKLTLAAVLLLTFLTGGEVSMPSESELPQPMSTVGPYPDPFG